MGSMADQQIGKSANQQVSKSKTRPGRRRFRNLPVLLLALAFGAMGLVNLGRAVQSKLNITLLAGWELSLSPQALLAFSVGWAVVFVAAGWGRWRRCRWGLCLGLWLPPVYGLYSVGVILLFTRSSYARGRWGLVALGWTAGTLVIRWLLTRARIRIQFTGQG